MNCCAGTISIMPSGPQQAGPPSDLDAPSMLARLRAGDGAAYERLVVEAGGRMLAVARRILGNDQDAQEAVQDAFLSAYKNLRSFEGGSKLTTWLHRITVNAALMKRRAKARRPERSIEDLLPAFHADGHRTGPKPPWQPLPQDRLESREMRELVHRLIDELPDDYRTILVLRDIEELDTASTAEALGISEPAVKTRLHRARQALRTLLEQSMAPEQEMTCKELIDFLDDYYEGRLPAEARKRFEAHLNICQACREYLQMYRDTVRMARASGMPEDREPSIPDSLVRAIIAAKSAASSP